MLVREAVEKFERGLIGQGASKNTVATYMRHLEVFSRFFDGKHVEKVTAGDINEFLYQARLKADGTEKAPRTMNSLKTALKSLFNSLPLDDNPTKVRHLEIGRCNLASSAQIDGDRLPRGFCRSLSRRQLRS
jgi:site-specific recombinase XerD